MLCCEATITKGHLDSTLSSAVDGDGTEQVRGEDTRFGIEGQYNQREDFIAGGKLQRFEVGWRITRTVVREEDAGRDDQECKRGFINRLQPGERSLRRAFNKCIPKAF